MFLFLIKKTFFDTWDNLGSVILVNSAFLLLLFVPLSAGFLPKEHWIFALLLVFLGSLLIFVYLGMASLYIRQIVDHEERSWKAIPAYFKQSWKTSLSLGLLATLLPTLLFISIHFYGAIGHILGMGALALLLWMSFFLLLSSLYYFPVQNRLQNKEAEQGRGRFRKGLKKGCLLFLDNTAITLLLFVWCLLLSLFSLVGLLLIPGPASILNCLDCCLKLLIFKYDYLEANPSASRRKIPWERLCLEENEKIGKRSLQEMFFPWKQ